MDAANQVRLRGVRALFARREDPYAGVDLETPRRLGGIMTLVGVGMGIALTVVAPPTAALGSLGWVVGIPLAAISFLWAFLLLRPGSRIGFDGMQAVVYTGIAQVCLIEWLAGGHGTPYHWLYLSAAVYPPSIHPPRRVAGLLLAATLATASPLVYQGWEGRVAADIALQIGFMWGLALIAMMVMDAVREHSVGLRREGELAHRLARVDALTGLGNRRAFDEALRVEVARADRTGRPLSLVVLDVNEFKAINDRFGHPLGDLALKYVGAVLRGAVRTPDGCFRWGGDEFAILLAETDLGRAWEIAARLGSSVHDTCVLPNGASLTISCGAARLDEELDAERLIADAYATLRADKGIRTPVLA